MRAHLGDQLVIETPAATGAARRDGEIVGLHHDDGTPPYDVRWSDTDQVTLVFPGPDARVRHLERAQRAPGREVPPEADATQADATQAVIPTGTVGPGDIGRRVAALRRRRGLDRAEAAHRARMAPDYLAYLEEQPADPSMSALIRLAAALGTSVAALRGGGMELPPGQGRALLRPLLRDLDADECRALLSTHGVGRIAVTSADGRPAVVPVNYEVVHDAIVFRTAPHSVAASAAETEVAFEVDHVDEALSRGWSVLAVGPASVVTDPEAVRGLALRAHSTPWAGGVREMWISIRPTSLTGRRITAADQ
ncbi:pyridoxamine 5'-phosphate oxidase family protein [Streptomyces sp. NPDC013172]|uniref:pyridoxamine 5'-phosphate oxidase family protein n=1 Tax=Streptomyces sp. NPDC013172 TaxID=3155009 RepID=UPI0033DAD878